MSQSFKPFSEVQPSKKLSQLELEILEIWRAGKIFEQSLNQRQGAPTYTFYEGPPTANGRPGVHHVQARAYKDLFPRYRTMRGFLVNRKAGWDCHGLPVEIEVEKKLGFSGKRAIEDYGVEPFNKQCRSSVMEYEQPWREMTERMGYWCDLDNAYMTMSNDFVESVWWSLKELWNKELLYKGYKVVPFCAKDGTPLSSHEVGLGYKEVRDPSIYVKFPIRHCNLELSDGRKLAGLGSLLVWTTTPWTLPGNVAAAVHPELDYVAVLHEDEILVLAQTLAKSALELKDSEPVVLGTWKGSELASLTYHGPYDYYQVAGQAHKVVVADFVTATDGTGIVHIAPAFGADDLNVARLHDLPVVHSVDATGHFTDKVEFLAGKWFKDGDPEVIRDLKARKILFRRADYVHSYPHCWRCKNPLMYFATDSWFIANTRLKERLIEKNQEIDWHPSHIKNGRYGDWLDNLVDWALSRTRYWGTPLPIWECSCGHREVVGSYQELGERAVTPVDVKSASFDPHRPYIDEIQIRCDKCQSAMTRIPDVIDCWYDSGAMPFAQLHYPFENKDLFEKSFPADFICEGLDQTRGWFNSLHQLGVMLFDSIAYKTVICHGLILDGAGQKMSKSGGNIVNPWDIFQDQGADALRWYLYASAPPDVSRRFSADLVGESGRRYLGTLWNTYYFFVLNANALKPNWRKAKSIGERPEIDRWIIAHLNDVTAQVANILDGHEVTPAARLLQDFVDDLSNWYVRRNRRRFWNGDAEAFATLHLCLLTLSLLTAPFTPFMAEAIYQNLREEGGPSSVHLCSWPSADAGLIDQRLLHDNRLALKAVSLGRSCRTASGHRTRQPLAYALVGAGSAADLEGLKRFEQELSEELNVKEIRFLGQQEDFLNFQIKPNLPLLGKKLGKLLPAVRSALNGMDAKSVARTVQSGANLSIPVGDTTVELTPEEILVEALSPEGYAAEEQDGLVVALSTVLTEELVLEGTARDLVRHIQELRKQSQLEITDRIVVVTDELPAGVARAIDRHRSFILEETLASSISVATSLEGYKCSNVQLSKEEASFQLGLLRV